MSELAKATKIERSSIYKMLSKDSNTPLYNLVSFAHNLGINFRSRPVNKWHLLQKTRT
jgi:DNA-binding phage protein